MAARSDTYGLFIGVNRYESEDIRPLAFASADVLAVRDKMAEKFHLESERAVVLADGIPGGKAPTRREILRAMNRFTGAPMKPEDAFFLVFAGHGFVCSGKTFLAATDSEIGSEALLRETAVSLDSIRDFLAEIKAGQHVVILDACRDSPVKGTRSVGSQSMSDTMTRDIGTVIRPAASSAPTITRAKAILCSCWEGQVAYEYPKGGHGWFCHNLLAELDAVASPTVSLADLHGRVKQRMKESAWRLLPSAKDQSPHLLIEGDVPMLHVATCTIMPPPGVPSTSAQMTEAVRQYCGVCGSLLTSHRFRCARCGQVCCLSCKNTRSGFCAKCAAPEPRTHTTSIASSPTTSIGQQSGEPIVRIGQLPDRAEQARDALNSGVDNFLRGGSGVGPLREACRLAPESSEANLALGIALLSSGPIGYLSHSQVQEAEGSLRIALNDPGTKAAAAHALAGLRHCFYMDHSGSQPSPDFQALKLLYSELEPPPDLQRQMLTRLSVCDDFELDWILTS